LHSIDLLQLQEYEEIAAKTNKILINNLEDEVDPVLVKDSLDEIKFRLEELSKSPHPKRSHLDFLNFQKSKYQQRLKVYPFVCQLIDTIEQVLLDESAKSNRKRKGGLEPGSAEAKKLKPACPDEMDVCSGSEILAKKGHMAALKAIDEELAVGDAVEWDDFPV
jgi:hypothetical protein